MAAEKTRPPPVKVLSGQLRAAGIRGEAHGAEGCLIRAGRNGCLRVSLVWMQGTVVEVQRETNSVLLMDETGTFTVQGVDAVPQGKPCLVKGTFLIESLIRVLFCFSS